MAHKNVLYINKYLKKNHYAKKKKEKKTKTNKYLWKIKSNFFLLLQNK